MRKIIPREERRTRGKIRRKGLREEKVSGETKGEKKDDGRRRARRKGPETNLVRSSSATT